MSVYLNETDKNLSESLNSLYNQIDPPEEIILVKDGPLSKDLEDVILNFEKIKSKQTLLKIIKIDKNVGLGHALNIGLAHCSYSWIVRMDSDDISMPKRFVDLKKSITTFGKSIDVIGANIIEFQDSIENFNLERIVPRTHFEIVKLLKWRSPMNHVSVAIKKVALQNVGGYKDFKWFEDYYLWVRMIKNGSKFMNIDSAHVYVRGGKDMISRRRGGAYFIQELKFQKYLFSSGITNSINFLFNIFSRGLGRLLPSNILIFIYSFFRNKKGHTSNK